MKNNSAKDQYFKDIKTLLPIKSTQEKKYLSKINKNLDEYQYDNPNSSYSDYIEKFGVLLGKNYLGALAVLIPFSSHFMSRIRSYMNVGALLNPYSPLKGALGGSLFADMIISLGNWGLLVAVPLGVIVAKLSHRITYSKSVDFWKCTTIYFSYSILLYVRGTAEDLALTGKRTIYLIILYIVFLNLRNRRKYEGNY